MARKRQLTNEDRHTRSHKSVAVSFREIAKKAKVSPSTVSYTIKRQLETGGNSKQFKFKKNQKASFWESTACVTGGSRDSSFKHSSTVVRISKSQFQLWREDLSCRFERLAGRKPLLKWQNKKKKNRNLWFIMPGFWILSSRWKDGSSACHTNYQASVGL